MEGLAGRGGGCESGLVIELVIDMGSGEADRRRPGLPVIVWGDGNGRVGGDLACIPNV